MAITGYSWVVLLRDVTHAAQVDGESGLHVAIVLDPETGHAFSAAPGASIADACRFAFETALMAPADPYEPGAPAKVSCPPEFVEDVTVQLRGLLSDDGLPAIQASRPESSFEDIADAVVGQLSGRPQPLPGEFPTPGDWTSFCALTHRYRQVEPWKRWSVAGQLSVIVRIDGTSARYLAIVTGDSDTQRGLILYPGGAVPPAGATDDGQELPPPAGTLLFYLDTPAEMPLEYRQRAIRYGWPADADLFPIVVTGGPAGPGDVDQTEVRHLSLALAALLQHDSDETATATSGALQLTDTQDGEFSITSVR